MPMLSDKQKYGNFSMDDLFEIEIPDFIAHLKSVSLQEASLEYNRSNVNQQLNEHKQSIMNSQCQKQQRSSANIKRQTPIIHEKQQKEPPQWKKQQNIKINNSEFNKRNQTFEQQLPNYLDKSVPTKSKQYAKHYRQRKKQLVKSLEEQNRYLKQKVDDLSFRLRQTELELNRLKHADSNNNHTSNFYSTKEVYLKQIQELLKDQNPHEELLNQNYEKLKQIIAFDSQKKLDLLNYFMSQLLQNIIDDYSFYYVDSALSKKGLWSLQNPNKDPQLRKIDLQVIQIAKELQNQQKRNSLLNAMPAFAIKELNQFKQLWKKLYGNYLNIVNKGFLIESLFKPIEQKMRKQYSIISQLKLALHFQKIKYRKDIRQMRESWFKQFENEKEKGLDQILEKQKPKKKFKNI